MIGAFFLALWRTVRRWACRLIERVLNWIAIKLAHAAKALDNASLDVSDAADAVGGAA
jgi:hypothetical protein